MEKLKGKTAGECLIDSVELSDIGFTNHDARVEASLVHFIKKYGQLRPIVVRQHTDSPWPVQAIEGRKIFAACSMAGIKKVFILNVGKCTDVEAEEINLALNGISFDTNYVKLSSTINRVYPGKNVDELAHMLPFPSQDIKDYIELEAFHWNRFKPNAHKKATDQFSMADTMFNQNEED